MGMVQMDASQAGAGSRQASDDELRLIETLRRGDESAFMALVDRYQATMVRLAMLYVSSHAVAEEVVQETWLGVLRGLGRFEGRSSLRTWIFSILTNRARTRGQREGRYIPFSALAQAEAGPDEPAVDPDRFLPADHERWPHHWATPPQSWTAVPEEQLLSQETRSYILDAIATLPQSQQTVITLRDIQGWTSEEVCNVLAISETNQRVLLHRARSKVRRALEQYLSEV